MNMNEHKLKELISKGEGISTEFKTCRNSLSRDVYETVCAFLNRHGGTILLGVKDSGEVQGIVPAAIGQIKKDFVTTINNPQKLHPPAYLSVDEMTLEGKQILRVYILESSQVHRCNGRIYDRNEDGDLDITDNTVQVAQLYQRKQSNYSENRVYPWIHPADLRADLIERCRRYVRINKPQHPWGVLDNVQLIKSAQLYQRHPETGDLGVTLAGVMLLAPDELILQVCPPHRTDLILRKVNVDRYDDRDLVCTNLIDSYDRIMAFIQKHLPDPFYLEGIERRSIRDTIFREVASNMLIHREYTSGATSRLIIEYGKVVTDNPSRPHGFGRLDPENTVPFQKNPVIGAFFRQIDRADELGSGMRKLMLYGKTYGGADPEMIEGDIFHIMIPIPEFSANPAKTQKIKPFPAGENEAEAHDEARVTPHVTPQVTPHVTPQVQTVLRKSEEVASAAQLQKAVGLKDRVHFLKNYLEPLLQAEWIERTIPDSPRSSKQKYRLTEKGRKVLERIERSIE